MRCALAAFCLDGRQRLGKILLRQGNPKLIRQHSLKFALIFQKPPFDLSRCMADIQPGDHVFARGGLENNVFVPKTVVIIGPEQWKRMQEWSGQGGGQRRRGAGGAGAGSAPAAGSTDAGTGGANAQKPAEPQN